MMARYGVPDSTLVRRLSLTPPKPLVTAILTASPSGTIMVTPPKDASRSMKASSLKTASLRSRVRAPNDDSTSAPSNFWPAKERTCLPKEDSIWRMSLPSREMVFSSHTLWGQHVLKNSSCTPRPITIRARPICHIISHEMTSLAASRSSTPMAMPMHGPILFLSVTSPTRQGTMMNRVHQPLVENSQFSTPVILNIHSKPATISARPRMIL